MSRVPLVHTCYCMLSLHCFKFRVVFQVQIYDELYFFQVLTIFKYLLFSDLVFIPV